METSLLTVGPIRRILYVGSPVGPASVTHPGPYRKAVSLVRDVITSASIGVGILAVRGLACPQVEAPSAFTVERRIG